jgi:cyclase
MKLTKLLPVTLLAALFAFIAFAAPQQQSRAQAAAAPVQTAPAQTPAPPYTLKPLGHNIFAAIANPGPTSSGSNAGFVIGDDGVLVVDTFQKVDAARALLADIRKITPLPIRFVVNTHYHIDHVTGNQVFADAGATIIAHRNVPGWIHTENLKFYGANPTPEQRASVEALKSPDVTYDNELNLYLGTRQIYLHFFPGHTGGDTMVLIPDANVVFCGDIFWRHTLPNLIDASTEPWIATLDLTLQHHPAGTFVSGHGDVGTADDVAAFRGYLADLRRDVQAGRAAGESGDALTNDVVAKLKDKYGDWSGYPNRAKTNVAQTDAEFAGTKKIPIPAPK